MIFERKVINLFESTLLCRHDPDGTAFYFSKGDFPGLICEEYSFLGDKGQRLMAYLYYRGQRRTDKLVMFDHGMGNGHAAYMQEINLLTEHGYTVFTYDHTGTRCSEGEHIGGFSQSVSDLDRAVKFVRTIPEYEASEIMVIGHSWGGFSTMNIAALHPDITKVVAISGFISPKEIINQVLSGPLALYRKAIYKTELDKFPEYAELDGRVTLANAQTRALIIHSLDDKTCRYKNHCLKLKKALAAKCENVEFLTLDGKGHNPNYTEDAVRYKDAFSSDLKARIKAKELDTDGKRAAFVSSYGWERMTRQDEDVWNKIVEFMEK